MKNSTIVLDATNHSDETFLGYLKSNNIALEILQENGPSGWPLVKLTGSRENLVEVVSTDIGWGDPSLVEFIK